MVLKTAAKNHNDFINGTIDKGHGFLGKDITVRFVFFIKCIIGRLSFDADCDR